MTAADRRSRVAVVIPTYNHAHFLADAIASVLAQTVPATEIVVVDDGSGDRPERVVDRHPGVALIRQPNRGLAAARNTGLRATTAPYLMFLDADDVLRPRAIEASLSRLSASPRAGFSYGRSAVTNLTSGTSVDAEFRPVHPDAFAELLRVNTVGMHGTVMYRRECLDAVHGFSAGLPACEDYDLYLRLAMEYEVVCGPEVLADYRQHGTNMSADPAFMLRAVLLVLRSHRDAAAARGLLEDYRAGVEAAKTHYLSLWWQRVKHDGIDAVTARQGLTLARLAPQQAARRAPRAMAARLRGGG